MFRSACIRPDRNPGLAVGGRRWGVRLLLAALWVAAWGGTGTLRADDASQVAILFNTRSPQSREVAEFYGRSRGVPTNQWIGLECSSETSLTRAAYEAEIQTPLRRILAERKLAKFDPATPALMTGTPLRYLLLVYGMPYRILHDSNRVETAAASIPQNLQYNGGSVDGDLMLLPTPPPVLITGPISNPFFAATNAAAMRPETGLFLVSRIDGPTPELAKGLVTRALEAERDGLWGRAFLDLRGLKEGPYKLGDDWLASAEAICRVMGFETEVDRNEATLGVGYPLSDVAVYAGWYDANASGPFTLPAVDFRPGAIAYHLHSFSAHDLRSPTANWVGPLVAKGATVTLGCVDEPYLQMTPNFGAFLARFAAGMNFAEAGAVSQPVLSWQTVLIGDPLYRPFSPDLFARSKTIEEKGPASLLPWTYLQRVNFFMQNGGDPGKALTDLESLPLAATNAVLAEKIAHLHAAKTRLKPAIAWAQKSLAAGGASPERGRLMLEMAEWQQTMDKTADAAATLRQFAKEFPNDPNLLSVRRQQLEYARDLDQTAEVEFLKAEVQRLSAAAAKPAGP